MRWLGLAPLGAAKPRACGALRAELTELSVARAGVGEVGYANTSFKGQLEYLWSELNGSESGALSKLRQTSSAYDAGIAFERYYERPAVINPARGDAAQRFYNGGN